MPRFIFVDTETQALSANGGTALAYTSTFSRRFRLLGVYLHFSEAITETITITKDAGVGSNYDTVLATADLSAETDYVFRPAGVEAFIDGDELGVAVTANNDTGTVYMSVYIEEY